MPLLTLSGAACKPLHVYKSLELQVTHRHTHSRVTLPALRPPAPAAVRRGGAVRARAALDEDTNERRTHAVLLICIWGARCRLCSGRVVTLVRVAGDAAAMRDGPVSRLRLSAQRARPRSDSRLGL